MEKNSKHNGFEYVDLGLPTGLKWATCNVGAKNPEERGMYFQWGETEDCSNKECNLGTYKFCTNLKMTKYTTADGLETLEPEDDAAHIHMSGDWRMPTREEIQELIDNTKSEWTKLNGVDGREFTGPNGNSIFIPASGRRYGSSTRSVGSICHLWSSSLNTSYPDYGARLYSYSGDIHMNYDIRYFGFSVRGVFK